MPRWIAEDRGNSVKVILPPIPGQIEQQSVNAGDADYLLLD
jgi:hypothetical protein